MKTILFLLLTLLSSFAEENKGMPRPWVQSAHGIALSVSPEKSTYELAEKVSILIKLTNLKGEPKIFQRGDPFVQYNVEVFYKGQRIEVRSEVKDSLYFATSPTGRVPVGKSWTERGNLSRVYDLSNPGKYVVRVEKTFGDPENAGSTMASQKQSSLVAGTKFEVVSPPQRPDSTAVPSEDLQVRLSDNRSVEDRRREPLILRLDVVNSGREPWFYHEQPIQRGIEFEVIDSKGRVFGRNKKGDALANSSPERFNRYSGPGPRSIEFLPRGTEQLGSFRLDDYTLLVPNSSYTVRVTWKGKAYRSSKDRAEVKKAIPFEIRSESISVRTPRD